MKPDIVSRFLPTPTEFVAPSLVVPRRNITLEFGMEQLELCGYKTVKKILKICLFIATEYTDG